MFFYPTTMFDYIVLEEATTVKFSCKPLLIFISIYYYIESPAKVTTFKYYAGYSSFSIALLSYLYIIIQSYNCI